MTHSRYSIQVVHQPPYCLTTTERLDGSRVFEVVEQLNDPWEAAYSIESQNGTPVLTGVQIRVRPPDPDRDPMETVWVPSPGGTSMQRIRRPVPPDIPPGGLSARQVRALRPGEALAECRRSFKQFFEAHGDQVKVAGQVFDASSATPKSSRGDRRYAEIAKHYVDALEAGSRHPRLDVVEKLGSGHTVNYVRDAIFKARERSILTVVGHGRAGGRLTERGRSLLD